ncbi:hypothetical protein M2M59_07560 [Rummeliibacillus sp. G93]|uniref:zinc metallopeptidase n=1 Tax=Rummeliibacillus TaxID=648802 RepID=UPI001174EBDC|nr:MULTISPECIES: zinc metallopeptidase [Rummeliibacillus]MBB5169390.1 hypothetical protein [Rummeliibacillus stabekisii]UQW98862.1 hypothetical protein M2M59_07560 [Rummeliibacillus sp. G93]GEL03650.1 hypothetical protein RST01_02770 [Rummeliibacillus stabekisii]
MISSWLRIASIYFAISVGYGIYMYATDTYNWVIYAHLLVLGWLSNVAIGYSYQRKNCKSKELERWQFYLFNIGLLLFFIGLIFGSVVLVWIGIVLIALSILLYLVRLFL